MIDRLNELGYAHRARAEQPGEFAIGRDALAIVPRGRRPAGTDASGSPSRRRPKSSRARPRSTTIDVPARQAGSRRVALDAPLITALIPEGREKRRDVPLAAIPQRGWPRR